MAEDNFRGWLNLTDREAAFIQTIKQQMGIVADLSRADMLLYGLQSPTEAEVLAHAQPHSLAHVYLHNWEGRIVAMDRRPEVLQALKSGRSRREQPSYIADGAPVFRETLPIYYPPPFSDLGADGEMGGKGRVVATLVIVTNLIEHERHRLRSGVFRKALRKLQRMLLYGQLSEASRLSPFGEQDGIVFTDSDGIIRYASGIAANLYRRLGYKETLVGRHLSALETEDEEMRRTALAENRCIEQESEEADRFWIRKALPLIAYPSQYLLWLQRFNFVPLQPRRYGVLITLHDATEIRRQNQEIQVKNAMIQEIHHRVKNNLQTIAGLLRMQIRRIESEEGRQALDDALKRILSVAVIHEFLSTENTNIINIKEVSHRIIGQFQQGMLHPDKLIRLELTGEPIYLPARQATACSLIINELLQNALEHGFEQKESGLVQVNLEDIGDEVIIRVADNGDGLPDDFDLDQPASLGWQIVKILVEGDLRGKIRLESNNGLSVIITFPKTIFRGEEGWKEHVLS